MVWNGKSEVGMMNDEVGNQAEMTAATRCPSYTQTLRLLMDAPLIDSPYSDF